MRTPTKTERALKRLGNHAAGWTNDCSGKQDFDGKVLSISTRYWPAGYGGFVFRPEEAEKGLQEIKNDSPASADAALILNGAGGEYVEIARQDFKAPTEAEVKAQVEAWVALQWKRAVAVLVAEFGLLKE